MAAAPRRQTSDRSVPAKLYARVLGEFGDDSVAQLGSAHLACEGVSNLLTKVLEWGRLMAYLEQSTRYVPYTDRPHGRWKYHVPAELDGSPLRETFVRTLDAAFETYARWIPALEAHFRARYPKAPQDSDGVYRAVIRAKALDTLRGLLPAATQSNVGVFGTGQGYEALLLRMFAHPLAEVRAHADAMLAELRQIIPAFLTRVDQPARGGRWTEYLAETRRAFEAAAHPIVGGVDDEPRPEVTLTDFDPEGETKVVAAALYGASALPDDRLLAIARRLSADDRTALLRAYAGQRTNRRHKPGRAFERTSYRFDVLTDYGAFRDLQRHRLLTLEWQPLSTRHGYTQPAAIEDAGAMADWREIMDRSAALYEALVGERAGRRRAVRGGDGVPGPLLHGHERAGSDARHRAPLRAAGTSGLPSRQPVDAPRDCRRRRAPRHRGRDAVCRSLGGGTGAAAAGTEPGEEENGSA